MCFVTVVSFSNAGKAEHSDQADVSGLGGDGLLASRSGEAAVRLWDFEGGGTTTVFGICRR